MDLKNKVFYVYEWYNKDTGEVFYVGKGKNGRYKNVKQRNQYFKNYYNKYNCDVRKVLTGMNEKEAFDNEIKLIKEYRNKGQCKCNIANGGEGCTLDENSREAILRKLQFIHSIRCYTSEMYNEEDYDYDNIKNKSKEELTKMYDDYLNYRDNCKENKYYYDNTDAEIEDKLNIIELKYKNKEMIMLLDFISEQYSKENNEFNGYYKTKNDLDFISMNIDWDKFLNKILNEMCVNKSIKYLIETINYDLKFLKFISYLPKEKEINIDYKIISFNLKEDKKYHIRLFDSFNKFNRIEIELIDFLLIFLKSFNTQNVLDDIHKEIIISSYTK